MEGVQDPNALNGIVNNGSAVSTAYLPGNPIASYQPVLVKPLSGILNQRTYLPLRFVPVILELSLVIDPLDPIKSELVNYQGGVALPANSFTNPNISTTWQIQNVQAKCDLVTLDSGLSES